MPPTDFAFTSAPFSSLTVDALYDLLALRSRVFVVEQRCIYQDPDGLDRAAWHVLARRGPALAGAARLVPAPGGGRIGRVVVAPEHRGAGLGRALVQEVIALAHRVAPGPLHLAAQAHLADFYGSLGFQRVGPEHDEDGILHVEMSSQREPPHPY